jgi:hypothetical protein
MVTGIALAGLALLFWMGLTLARIYSTVDELRRSAGEPVHPDIEYPAFSRDEVRHAYHRLDKALVPDGRGKAVHVAGMEGDPLGR